MPSALPRNRSIEMMSTTISTNLNCNMSCRHCYIQPELLRLKEYIDESTYRRCVEVIIEAFRLDDSVTYLHLDVLGGEATLMPYEFWERNLPWTLDRISELNAEGIQTEFTFCTNLMWKDERYLDLLRAHRHHPAMDIAISFEGGESGRFGRGMAIFPKFLQRIEALGDCNMLNLVLIMGQGVIDLGPDYIIETFVKRGITDITCDMIFPWGSGKAYFQQYQPKYADVARFIAELTEKGKPYGLTVDHLDDIRKSLGTLSRSQNTLNDAYEYHWDHRGNLSLNPNQTGTEAVLPSVGMNAWDKHAALKVVWSNSSELDRKLSYQHSFCEACPYLQACNSGWYPHKALPEETLRNLMGDAGAGLTSCPGFFELWDALAPECLDLSGVTRYGDERRLRRLRRKAAAKSKASQILYEEAFIHDYDGFFQAVQGSTQVQLFDGALFGLTPRERLWFYDRVGLQVEFSGGLLNFGDCPQIIAHALAGNYHTVDVEPATVTAFAILNPHHRLSSFIGDAICLAAKWENLEVEVGAGVTVLPSGLEVSHLFEDLILWAMVNLDEVQPLLVTVVLSNPTLKPASKDYLQRIKRSAYRLRRFGESYS